MKLRYLIIAVIFVLNSAQGAEVNKGFKPSFEDISFAEDLANSGLMQGLSAIKEKYLELAQMIREQNGQKHGSRVEGFKEAAEADISSTSLALSPSPVLRVFVSRAMGGELLKSYAQEAKKYGAVLVFNGLPGNSWQELGLLVSGISNLDDEIAIQIDDESFKRFAVKSVPTFVLSEEEGWEPQLRKKLSYDLVTGNIGIRRALELFAKEGDMAGRAKSLLEGS